MKKIICIVGTRPEAIKMAPVIKELQKEKSFDVRVLATAQHREILDQVLNVFEIKPDIDINIMRPDQKLATLTGRLLIELDKALENEKPDAVLVQGDTTTVMSAALACFYRKIPVGHIEAGLRTWDIYNPYPEELNRVIAGKIAQWHFAPTEISKENLRKEGTLDEKIFVTGNTVVDALLKTIEGQPEIPFDVDPKRRLILVTCHRRENFGEPLKNICHALKILAENNPLVQFVFPVHPNPNVRSTVNGMLSEISNITLCEPLGYVEFIATMQRSYLILSDSGGVQEEAPAIGKPVLVLREETERPEAIMEGVVKLVGSNTGKIVEETQRLLDDRASYDLMSHGVSPYGDGHASERITNILRDFFNN